MKCVVSLWDCQILINPINHISTVHKMMISYHQNLIDSYFSWGNIFILNPCFAFFTLFGLNCKLWVIVYLWCHTYLNLSAVQKPTFLFPMKTIISHAYIVFCHHWGFNLMATLSCFKTHVFFQHLRTPSNM